MPRIRRPLLALVALLAALAVGYGFQAVDDNAPSSAPVSSSSLALSESLSESSSESSSDPTVPASSSSAGVPLSALPAQVGETVRLIEAGGPFPFPGKDGENFGNFEGRLPREGRGFYRAYTVPTPGEDDRGARRLIVGRDGRYWYTTDHYESFVQVDASA